eukprot:g19767.t1
MAGDGALVNSQVYKMLNNFAAWKIKAFEPPRVDTTAMVFTNDRFAAFVCCLQAFIEAASSGTALTAAHSFVSAFHQMSTDLNVYMSKHRGAFQGVGASGPGSMMTNQLEKALDDDFAAITKHVGNVASELKDTFRDEPPGEDDVFPAVPPVVLDRARRAISDIHGVHTMADMMKALSGGSSGGAGGSGSVAKKQKTATGVSRAAPTSNTKAAAELKSGLVDALKAAGCPFNTCRFYWENGRCGGKNCPFLHDQTKVAVNATARGGGADGSKRSVRFSSFGSGGGFSSPARDRADGGGSSGGGFSGGSGGGNVGGGGSGAGGFRRG